MKKLLFLCTAILACNLFNMNTKAESTPIPSATPSATPKATSAPKEELSLPQLPNKLSLIQGQNHIKFAKLARKKISYTLSSSDEQIVEIVDKSHMHALHTGTATITIDTALGSHKCKVKVKKKGLAYPEFTMLKGETLPLCFTNGEKMADYHWKSNHPKIATVNKNGLVTAKTVGNTYITGISDNKQVSCKLTIKKKPKKIIYLTFDDGPSRSSTPKILSILKKNNVKATFFELKPAIADFDLTKKIITEGHTLALHGYSHKYDQIYRSESIYHNNLDSLRNLFFKKFGVWCTLSRFPGGSSNTVSHYNHGIMSRLSKLVPTWGYRYYDWNVSSGDAGGAKNPRQVYRNITRSLHAGSNVILMHDFPNNTKTINALNRVIQYGKKHGYTFLPLSASTAEVHHPINN